MILRPPTGSRAKMSSEQQLMQANTKLPDFCLLPPTLTQQAKNIADRATVSLSDGLYRGESNTVIGKAGNRSEVVSPPIRSLAAYQTGPKAQQRTSLASSTRPELRRASSDVVHPVGETGSSDQDGRRSIFGSYWKKGRAIIPTTATPPPTPITEKPLVRNVYVNRSPQTPDEIDIRVFSPPEGHRQALREHFSRIDEFGDDIPVSHSLPPLPTPLQRYCSEGACTGGMYPLMKPRPILRSSSYGFSKSPNSSLEIQRGIATRVLKDSAACTSRGPPTIGGELTKSPALKPMIAPFQNPRKTASLPLSHHDSDSSSEKQGVQFDPRVTVTEYEDNERVWFTDEELNQFKYDATLLAQRYMMANPHVAQQFRRGRVDPITGKLRQRALYTNPVFAVNGDDTFAEDDGEDIREMLETEIKRVLIVDPNPGILNLFCKSLQHLFPHTRIAAAQTSEDALKIVQVGLEKQAESNGVNKEFCFDIIVVEENLSRRKKTPPKSHRRMSGPSKGSVSSTMPESRIPSMPDLEEGECQGMTGSQLLKRITDLEKKHSVYSSISSQRLAVSSKDASPSDWTPLLIGVSVNIQDDRLKMTDSGADVLWGKPPPPMDIALRNKLLRTLMTKRATSSPGTAITKSLRMVPKMKCDDA